MQELDDKGVFNLFMKNQYYNPLQIKLALVINIQNIFINLIEEQIKVTHIKFYFYFNITVAYLLFHTGKLFGP